MSTRFFEQTLRGYSGEEDSFCLQLQVQSTQAEPSYIAPQQPVTNLEYKLTPHKKRTKFLRARKDTCANVNLMPISVYQLLYTYPDCQKLAPSNRSKLKLTALRRFRWLDLVICFCYTQIQSV